MIARIVVAALAVIVLSSSANAADDGGFLATSGKYKLRIASIKANGWCGRTVGLRMTVYKSSSIAGNLTAQREYLDDRLGSALKLHCPEARASALEVHDNNTTIMLASTQIDGWVWRPLAEAEAAAQRRLAAAPDLDAGPAPAVPAAAAGGGDPVAAPGPVPAVPAPVAAAPLAEGWRPGWVVRIAVGGDSDNVIAEYEQPVSETVYPEGYKQKLGINDNAGMINDGYFRADIPGTYVFRVQLVGDHKDSQHQCQMGVTIREQQLIRGSWATQTLAVSYGGLASETQHITLAQRGLYKIRFISACTLDVAYSKDTGWRPTMRISVRGPGDVALRPLRPREIIHRAM